jgi:hypothetical protein
MIMEKNRFAGTGKRAAARAAMALLIAAGGAGQLPVQASPQSASAEPQEKTPSKFYCNINALDPAERARQKQLTQKLIAAHKEIVETEKGYEFQYSPASVSLGELVEWVAAEAKCCPFFDFHIDLEREGSLLCLRLTGSEGIKPFIRTAFQVPAK